MTNSWKHRLRSGPWLKHVDLRTWFYLVAFENAVWILYVIHTRTVSDSSILFLCTFWAVLPLPLLLAFRGLFWLTLAMGILNWPIRWLIIPHLFPGAASHEVAQSTFLAIQIGVVATLLGEIFRLSRVRES